MKISRRRLIALASVVMVAPVRRGLGEGGPLGLPSASTVTTEKVSTMYGLIGKMTAVSGQRDALASILAGSTQEMPGCLSYVIATDPSDADALWITEVWDSAASHKASLSLPAVQAAIAKAKPLIAGFSNRVETVPISLAGAGKTAAP